MIVRRIREGRGTVLVQWQEGGSILRRGWIPLTSVGDDNEVSDSVLRKAAPYGIPLEKILPKVVITPTNLANALHARDVWTEQDVYRNPNEIAKALLSCMGWHVAQLQTKVREFSVKKEEV